MELNLVRLVIEVSPESFSALEPLLAGKGVIFADALRHVCCTRINDSCSECPLHQHCPAGILTSRTLSQDPDLVKQHQKPSLPYVFKKNSIDRQNSSGIGLVLLGTASIYLPEILSALEHILGGRRSVIHIAALDYQDTAVSLDLTGYTATSFLPVLAADEILCLQRHRFSNCSHVRLALQTPLRILKENRELNRFDPVAFCRSVVRRVSSLTAYYGDAGVDHDLFRSLSEVCGQVRLLGIAENHKSVNSSQRGVTGCYELSGPFADLGPLLYLGGIVQVGKRASYGFGSFDIAPALL